MESKLTPKDIQILQYICENFSCTICNSILLQCVTLSCGHHYCNYCVDLLHAGMMHQCPQCSSPFNRAQPNNAIDQQIDNLINSCSELIQKAYASAVNSRFQKSLERRNKVRRNEGKSQNSIGSNTDHEEIKLSDYLEYVRGSLQTKKLHAHHARTKCFKSAERAYPGHEEMSQANGNVEWQLPTRPRSKLAIRDNSSKSQPYEAQNEGEIDINKVNLLFGIYEHVLNLDNEPNKEMAGGDFIRDDQDLQELETQVLEGMSNFTKRSEVELETLIKETDDIVRLDGHMQKWTNRIKDALCGNNESTGMADEKFDNSVRCVDDELWRASNELLQKLQGMQKKRKTATKSQSSVIVCPPIPKPRSHKLNVDVVSDDESAEEYENALEILQESLDDSYNLQKQAQNSPSSPVEQCTTSKTCPSQEMQHQSPVLEDKIDNTTSPVGDCSTTRTRHVVDSVEESGQMYVKENIEFITKMRKYKEALMKIQKHEVVTAQEIKELVPTSTFPPDESATTPASGILLKCRDVITPRRLSQISQGSRQRNHSYSARLPSSASNERRPMTATYDVPSTQRIRRQIAVVPSKQYLKQRARTNNSLFTAR